MKKLLSAISAIAIASAAHSQFIQTNFAFSGGNGGSQVTNTFLFAAEFPGGTTPVVAYNLGTITDGTTTYDPNPNQLGTKSFSDVLMGIYTDNDQVQHVVFGTGNDLSGNTFSFYFPNFSEALILNDLQTGNAQNTQSEASILAGDILANFLPAVQTVYSPDGSVTSGYLTSFSNGVNFGSVTAVQASPEPNNLYGLLAGIGLTALLCKQRSRA